MIIPSITPFKIDGVEPVDYFGRPIFMTDFQWTPLENFYEDEVLTGDTYLTYRITRRNGVKGPTGFTRHKWSMRGITDETGFNNLMNIYTKSAVHTAHTKIRDMEWFDGDGSTLTFSLHRPLLGNAYGLGSGATAEMGVNAGVAAAYASSVTVYNRITGVTYTPVWNAGPAAGQVRINSTGAGAFQTLVFEAPPDNYPDAFRVVGSFLYTTRFFVTNWNFARDINGQIEVEYAAEMKEIGTA